jgi:hypothetical protein
MKNVSFLPLILFSIPSYGYDFGSVEFKQATYNQRSNTLDIVYDLSEAQHNYFNYAVELYYSLDGAQTFVGPMRLVRGDVGGNVSPGANKSISWDFSIEAPDFTGNNIIFSIKAKARMRPEYYSKFGGPRNAAWSALLPGLGDMKVRHYNKYYNLGITAVALGTVGMGMAQRLQAQDRYDQYKLADTSAAADALYTEAQDHLKKSTLFFGAALAVWITDVALVAVQGVKNKKMIRETFPKVNVKKASVAVTGNAAGIGLALKF